MPASRSATAIHEVQVCGQKLIAVGSVISIKPATGSSGIAVAVLSMGHSPRDAPRRGLRQQSKQMMQLIDWLFRCAQRQHRNAEFACPCEDPAQPGLAHVQNVTS